MLCCDFYVFESFFLYTRKYPATRPTISGTPVSVIPLKLYPLFVMSVGRRKTSRFQKSKNKSSKATYAIVLFLVINNL